MPPHFCSAKFGICVLRRAACAPAEACSTNFVCAANLCGAPCCLCTSAEVDAAYGQREAALEAYRQEEQGRQAERMLEAKQQRSKARG